MSRQSSEFIKKLQGRRISVLSPHEPGYKTEGVLVEVQSGMDPLAVALLTLDTDLGLSQINLFSEDGLEVSRVEVDGEDGPIEFSNSEELFTLLGDQLIAEWNLNFKNAENLWEEYEKGDISFVVENGELVRVVNVARVYVFYQDENGTYHHLREVMQEKILQDGTVEIRERGMDYAGGKIKVNQSPEEGALAELLEELFENNPNFQGYVGNITIDRLEYSGLDQGEVEDSHSYPGLASRYDVHNFRILLQGDEIDLAGYREEKKGKDGTHKINYFNWV